MENLISKDQADYLKNKYLKQDEVMQLIDFTAQLKRKIDINKIKEMIDSIDVLKDLMLYLMK